MSVLPDYIAYTFIVGGNKEKYRNIRSIVEQFHSGESKTKLLKSDADKSGQAFTVYSEHDTDNYDYNEIELSIQAVLDIIKLQAVLRRHNENMPPLQVCGASMENYDITTLFSIKNRGRAHTDIVLSVSQYDLGEYYEELEDDFPDFSDYYTPEGVKKIQAILEEIDDEEDVGDKLAERFADAKEPFTNRTIGEYMQEFENDLEQFDDLFR